MNQLTSLYDVDAMLKDRGPFDADFQHNKVGDLLDTMLHVAEAPEVFDRHDDHLGLKDDMSPEFLEMTLDEAEELSESHPLAEQRQQLLEQAQIIIPLAGLDTK